MKKSPLCLAIASVCLFGLSAPAFAADPAPPAAPKVAAESTDKPAVDPAKPSADAPASKEGKCDMSGSGCCGGKAKSGKKGHKMKKSAEPAKS